MQPARLANDPARRQLMLERLRSYRAADEREERHRTRILAHVEDCGAWWHRDTLPGHVTASAFIVDTELEQMLLHHHRKLDRWLQLGGHDDGEQDPARTVLREIEEESGLTDVAFFGGAPAVFDLDVHPIPATATMTAHDHLDVRFLVLADPGAPLQRAEEESLDLAWFPLTEAQLRMGEAGALRVVRKILDLRAALQTPGG